MKIKNSKYLKINATCAGITALFILLNAYFYEMPWQTAVGWAIGLYALLWCAYTDIRVQRAPDKYLKFTIFAPFITYMLNVLSVANPTPLICAYGLVKVVAGMSLAAGFVWLIRITCSLILKKEAMGEGDIFPCAMVGGLIGSIAGIQVFLYSPFAMIPLLLYQLVFCPKNLRWPKPLLPAITLITIFIYPITSWTQQFLWPFGL